MIKLWVYLTLFCQICIAQMSVDEAWTTAEKQLQKGPQTINLVWGATFQLPKGFAWIPAPEANAIQKAQGNPTTFPILGMVIELDVESSWNLILEAQDLGFIPLPASFNKDLLTQIQQQNKHPLGIRPISWIQSPQTQLSPARISWGLNLRDESQHLEFAESHQFILAQKGGIHLISLGSLDEVQAKDPLLQAWSQKIHFSAENAYQTDTQANTVSEWQAEDIIAGFMLEKKSFPWVLGILTLIGVLTTFGLWFLWQWIRKSKA